MAEKKTGSSRSKTKSKPASAKKGTASKSGAGKTSKGGAGKKTTAKSSAGAGLDKSVEAFRDSLEHSITLSRDRLQDIVDDAVHRGRMTRGDAEKMVSDIVGKGRRQTDSMLGELERVIKQFRKEVRGGPKQPRKQPAKSSGGSSRKSTGGTRKSAGSTRRKSAGSTRRKSG